MTLRPQKITQCLQSIKLTVSSPKNGTETEEKKQNRPTHMFISQQTIEHASHRIQDGTEANKMQKEKRTVKLPKRKKKCKQ